MAVVRRGHWRPPLYGRDLALVVTVHFGVFMALLLPVCLAVSAAELGWAGMLITVPASLNSMWLAYRVAGRVASWRVQTWREPE